MKKTLLSFALLLAATAASAGTYTVTTTAAQDARLARHLTRVNTATCASVGLPASCTQAQARDIQPGIDVYANVADMIDRTILRDLLANLKNADTSDDAAQAAASWAAKTDAQKNAVCALLGLPNGCEAWPR